MEREIKSFYKNHLLERNSRSDRLERRQGSFSAGSFPRNSSLCSNCAMLHYDDYEDDERMSVLSLLLSRTICHFVAVLASASGTPISSRGKRQDSILASPDVESLPIAVVVAVRRIHHQRNLQLHDRLDADLASYRARSLRRFRAQRRSYRSNTKDKQMISKQLRETKKKSIKQKRIKIYSLS